MTKKTKIWAIGFLDWVELRESPTRPKAVPSETIMTRTVGRKEVKPVLKQVTHTGGDVLGVAKAWLFREITGRSLRRNQVLMISQVEAKKLLSQQVVH